MKQIFILLFLGFSVFSGFSQTKRKVSKNTLGRHPTSSAGGYNN